MAKMLNGTVFNSDKFTWEKANRTFVGEASYLSPYGQRWMSKLYPDAEDMGIFIRSVRTGKVEAFVLSKIEEKDGDLLYWEFKGIGLLSDVFVKVFND